MKLKKDLMLREVAGSWIVVPVGAMNVSFNRMLTLNGSGALLWRALERGADAAELTDVLCAEYEVERPAAEADVEKFLKTLQEAECLEESV